MKTKLILSSVAVAAFLGSCSNEELFETKSGEATLNRPTVNLVLTSPAQTRLSDNLGFDITDDLGAVIVDDGQGSIGTIMDNHIGNNKWEYDANLGRFTTQGTTAIGSWLFYSAYNSDMTTKRTGVEYTFPQIQEGAADYSQMAKNHSEFYVSPIITLDGYEGQTMEFEIKTPSIHSRAELSFEFPAGSVTEVQKIVVKAVDADNTPVDFILAGKIKNTEVPVADVRESQLSFGETANQKIDEAYAKLVNRGDYNYLVMESEFKEIATVNSAVPSNTAKYLVLDCIDHETKAPMAVTNNKFKAFMSMPAGKYSNITFYIYTNNGIYKKEITKTQPNKEDGELPAEDFLLRRGTRINFTDISKKATEVTETLKITEVIDNGTATSETEGTVVIKTEDLIAAINAIETNGEVKINVISDAKHTTIINKAVADALAGVLVSKSNVQLKFTGAVVIEGTESADSPLLLQHMTFDAGCTVTKGYVEVGNSVKLDKDISAAVMTVESAANVFFATNVSVDDEAYNKVINHGTITIAAANSAKQVKINTLENNGTVNVGTESIVSTLITYTAVINNSTINVVANGSWFVKGLANNSSATIINNGVIRMTDTASTNAGKIENNANINLSATLTNSGTIENKAGANLISGDATDGFKVTTGQLNNTGIIDNEGVMYCVNGGHTINNTNTINAKAGSRTYITTNSVAAETTSGIARGEVKCTNRNADMTVAVKAQQGYISWIVPATITSLSKETGDKFNKVYLNGNCNLTYTDQTVKYIVIDAKAEVQLKTDFAELTANADATLIVEKKSIANLTIAENKTVSVPTGNILGVYDYKVADVISESAAINNNGTLLVGGKFFSTIGTFPNTGIFASGSGQVNEAYFWGKADYTE